MAKESSETKSKARRNNIKARAKTPQDRENQLINLAIDLAESQLRDGSATSQVITHFLKLATEKERLENEKLRSDLRVADAKIRQIQSADFMVELYQKAINALKTYQGSSVDEDMEFYDD